MAWDDIQESGSVIDMNEWNAMVTVIKQGGPSGALLDDLLASGVQYTDIYKSGAKLYDSYNWYNTSSNQLSNWLASGEQLSRWFSESAAKLSLGGDVTLESLLDDFYPSSLGKLNSGATLWADGSRTATGELTLPYGIQITPTTDPGDSQSTGGAVNVTMTSVDGSAIVVYTNKSSSDGHLVQIGSDNQNFNKSNLRVWSDSDATTVVVTHNNVSSQNETMTITSLSSGNTVYAVTGKPASKGVAKIVHTGTDGDSSAAGMSIDLTGAGTAAQGYYFYLIF